LQSANASGLRRTLDDVEIVTEALTPSGDDIAPLLRKLMADYAADGLPPAYLVKDDPQTMRDETNET